MTEPLPTPAPSAALTTPAQGGRGWTARSLALGLPVLLLWVVMVSWTVPDPALTEQHLILVGGFGALFSLFALKLLADFLPPRMRPSPAEWTFVYALLAVGIPTAAMGRVALESAVANHFVRKGESGRRGLVPEVWAPNPHIGWVPELDPPDARCPYLELPPKEDGTPRRTPLEPARPEASAESAREAVARCAAALEASRRAAEGLDNSRDVLDTLEQVRRAGELAQRALAEFAKVPDPARAAYLAWAAQRAAERAERGPGCVERAHVLHGYRKGKAAVPWNFWLGPMAFWFLVVLAFEGTVVMGLMLLRESWVEKERLPFPYARIAERTLYPLPGAGADPEKQESFPTLASGVAFFAGLLFCLNGLVSIGQTPPVEVPPALSILDLDLSAFHLIPNVTIRLLVVPFALLVILLFPLDLLSTAVFAFLLAAFGVPWFANQLGYTTTLDVPYYVFRMGGMLGISATLLFLHRKELLGLLTGLWRGAPGGSSDRALSPRELAAGFLLSLGLFCALIIWAERETGTGLDSQLMMMAFVLFMIFVFNFPHIRLRAYGAFQYFEFNLALHSGNWANWHLGGQVNAVPMAQGSPIMEPDRTLHYHSLYNMETFGHYHQALGPGSQVLDAFSLGEATGARPREIFRGVVLALVLALLVVMPLFLVGVYHTGYDNTPQAGSWENIFVSADKAYNYYGKQRPGMFTQNSFGWVLLGAAIFAVCMGLRRRHARFPIEPMGLFLAGADGGRTVNGTDRIWFTLVVALLLKWVIFRWYGVRTFQERVVPWVVYGLMGMVLGMLLYLFLSALLLSQGWMT